MGKKQLLSKDEYNLLVKAEIDLKGFDKALKTMNSVKPGGAGMDNIIQFAGTLSAFAQTIKKINNSGFSADVSSVVKEFNAGIAALNKMQPEYDKKITQGKQYGDKKSLSKRMISASSAASFEGAFISQTQVSNRALIDARNQFESNINRENALLEKRKFQLTNNANIEKQQAKERLAMDKRVADARTSIMAQARTELAKDEKAKAKIIENGIREQDKLDAERIKRRDKLLGIKGSRDSAGRIVASISGADSKLSSEDVQFKVKQINAELRKMPEIMRKVQSEKLAKDLELAGVKTNNLNGKLSITELHGKKIQSHFSRTIKEMFSMEKIFARMSFVITAKLSYDIFNTLQRLPMQIINTFKEFEESISKTFALMANVSNVTKLRLQNDVIGLSKIYGIAAKEISFALYEIISAQVPLSQATKVLEQAIKLSLAGQSDLTGAAHSLVQIINAYELGFENIARVSDVAFQAVKYGQLTMQQYTDEMQKVIATASIFKISQEEISAAIATMTINGNGASQAFTALNQMLMVIANPTERAKKLMEDLGISLSIQDIQEKGLGFALQSLTPLLKMTGKAGEELIATIFKTRTGFKAVASLLQNMNEYGDNYVRMIDSAGATEEALAERTNDVSFQMNKMKTAWESFMISILSGKNKNTLLSFFKDLTSLIGTLEKNFSIVVAILKILVTQIAVMGSIHLIKFVSGIRGSVAAIKSLSFSFRGMSVAAAAAWGQATLGLSLLVQGIVQAIHWFGIFTNNLRSKKLSKLLGIDEANKTISETNAELVKLDANISELEGVKKMIGMYDQLANKQNKSNKEIAQMSNLFSNIETILKNAGITIDSTGKKVENLAKYIVDVDKRIQELTNKRMLSSMRKESSDLRVSLKDFSISSWGTIDNKVMAGELNRFFGIITKTITGSVSKAISGGDFNTINARAKDIYSAASNERQYFEKHLNAKEATPKEKADAQKAIDAMDAIIDFSLSLQSMVMEKNLNIKIPEFREIYNGGGGKPSEKDFMSQIQSLYTKAVGNKLTLTLEEWQKAEIKSADDILAEINKFEGTVLNKQASLDAITQYKKMVETNNIVGLWSSAQEAISAQIEQAKALKNIGDVGGAGNALMSAKATYDSFLTGIKESTDEQLIAGGVKPEDISSFRIAMSTAMAKYLSYWFEQAKDILTDAEFIKEAMKTYGFDQNVLDDFSKLESTIKELEESGQKDQADTLKKIKEMILVGFREELDNLFGITTQPEFIQNAVKTIKESISNNKITDPISMEEMIQKAVVAMRATGMTVTDENITAMRSDIIPKPEKEPKDNWKKYLGIADYKTKNEAMADMANKTISTLQSAWSFYWEWEMNKLKEQQAKKLEALENEKKMMLANQNMSSEQKQIIEERFAEKKKQLDDKLQKEINERKKKQAMFDASVDLAKGLIGIWSVSLGTKAILGVPEAIGLSALLSGIFAAQLAMINNQKYAGGGYTGSGFGSPDETGYKPAGIVHGGELVIDKTTLDRNFNPMMSLYGAMRSGQSFDKAIANYIMGKSSGGFTRPVLNGSYAGGGYVSGRGSSGSSHITIDLAGARMIDDIELHKRVEIGGKKRRYING